jgi:hypothetical protein
MSKMKKYAKMGHYEGMNAMVESICKAYHSYLPPQGEKLKELFNALAEMEKVNHPLLQEIDEVFEKVAGIKTEEAVEETPKKETVKYEDCPHPPGTIARTDWMIEHGFLK